MRSFPNPYNPQIKSKGERRASRAARVVEATARFEADICPETRAPRLRFNFANGWTASVVLRMGRPNGCDFMMASVAAWPTGMHGMEKSDFGPTEASADEALRFLDEIQRREPRL
jgi:hypothetical protein